ncbi:MAG TPA: class I SAM-dependent methyltransferase [Pseudonocardiaceae bacterium]|jgi:SAM-dependent methyltransferase|nr:class I SAM-dependent methyltransferase [Pseudonocardiaceae bacterium]
MPTIPPEPVSPPAREPHQARQIAESFGLQAQRYDRARPRYPDAMVEAIVAASPGPDLLDVGCGTGIAARQFQAAGCRVLGVEPDPRMAQLARDFGVTVEEGKFEDWDPTGRTFDTVIAAQAWHWVDPVAGVAQAARVLRPGGRLAVFWNAFETAPEVAEALSAVFARVLPDSPVRISMVGPDSYSAFCVKTAEELRKVGGFDDSQEWRFGWDRVYTRDEWLDQIPTSGGHSQIPPAKQEELLSGTGAAIDELGGSFTVNYTAVVLTAARAQTD